MFTVAQAQTCTVNWNTRHQRIDGFGASSAFTGFTWTTNMANMFFTTNNGTGLSKNGTNYSYSGIGLSLLRSQIQPGGFANANEITLMQYAQARGAKIWSTPWSPQASFKNNNNTVGGTILSSSYQAYANQLAGYVANLKSTYGISNFYALSIQNEPDATVTYASCYWNAQQFHDFVPFLYNAMVASNVSSTKIMLPESENWPDYSNLVVTAMTDPTTSNMVGIVADHNYDGANGPANLTKNSYGKPLWETEVSTFDPNDGSISNGVYWASRIYLFMTQAQVNAYHFWWLINLNADNEGLTDNNYVPDKRMYTMGQYSRFIRPGFYRIDATNTGSALISAYNDTNTGSFVIVAVNPNTTSIGQTFNLNGFPGLVSSVTPWITSGSLTLISQTPMGVSGSMFSYTLPAQSVVTFVGQATQSQGMATTLGLIGSGTPSTYGNTVTFTATVQTNGVAVGGISGETVSFYDGTTSLGSGNLNGSGQAAYTTTANQLSATTHSITAVYPGDATYASSTNSPALSQTVNPATLTAGLTGTASKSYNGTTTATLAVGNYTLAGVVSGDSVTLNDPAGGTYDTRNVGTGKTVTVTGLAISGASATNYTLASSSVFAAIGTISKTNITVTAAANVKTYDGTTNAATAPTITTGGVQIGDTAGFAETYDTRNVGTSKTLTPKGSVSDGNGGTNYNYTFVAGANGTINAATLTYTANAATMTYGSAVPALSGSVSGFVSGDNQANATTGTLTFTTTATSSSKVGTYAIIGSGLTANNGNYTFVQSGSSGALTIGALPVNLTGTRAYDGTTTVAAGILSVANKIGSDNVTVASGSGTVASPNVGTQPIASFGTLALGGPSVGNYTLAGASGSVTITTAATALTVTNLLALDRVYDGTTNATLDATNAGLVGVVNGDDVTLISSNAFGYFADKNAGTNKPVTVIGLTLGGLQASNYALVDPTNITATIIPVGLAVTGVTAADKVFDGTTAATLTGTAVLSGQVVSNDIVSLVTSNVTANFADANVGTNKPVTATGYALTGADAGNYTLTQPTGLSADILPLVMPAFGNPAITVGPGGSQLSFSAQNGQSYKVLATTNLALTVSQWTILTNGTFGVSGTATFTDSSASNLPQRFYLIVSP